MRLGIFDSGIGGITVLSEIRRRFGRSDLIYLGDTANVPYGSKSEAQVRSLATSAVRALSSRGVDAVVVACNTASAVAMEEIRAALSPIPVFGVVEAGVEAGVRALTTHPARQPAHEPVQKILVLATRATVRSGIYARSLRAALGAGATPKVIEQACPLLVPMIEEGWREPGHSILRQTVDTYVGPYAGEPATALLACTHYPWIEAVFAAALPGWNIVNSAACMADLLASRLGKSVDSGKGTTQWYFTDPEAIPSFARDELSRLGGAAPIQSI